MRDGTAKPPVTGLAPPSLGKCRRYIVESDVTEYVSFVEIQRAELGFA
jgi:hypothetical protein